MSAPSSSLCPGDALEAVFSAESLRALDARGRADVRAVGKLSRKAPSAVVFHAGEPADTLFVLSRGVVRLEPAVGSSPRTIRAGETFGDEALVPFAVRRTRAVVVEAAELFALGVGVYRRVLVRAGFPELLARAEARARRAEWLALASTTPLGALPGLELEALVSALVEEPCEKGEALGGVGASRGAWLVAGGLFELATVREASAPRSVYAARGDFVGVSEALAHRAPPSARALGSALALRLPGEALEHIAARHPPALAALERGLAARQAKQRRTLDATRRPATRHASDEMERLGSASSLLAIDLERCTRCGHCTSACADSHGSARLERRGEKLVVSLRHAESIVTTALLLPSACQHCHEPACLDPCPTGAIRRDATGAVELDEDLCTGCGACAKACPWEAIRMAERPPSEGHPVPGRSLEIAVKCDLCRGHDGPACVSACPTDAIFRLDPARDVAEVRAALGRTNVASPERAPEARRAGSRRWARGLFALAAVPPLVALSRSLPEGAGHGARLAFGVFAALLTLVLASHAVLKRVASVRRRARRALSVTGSVSIVAPFVAFHAVSGAVATACVIVHSGAGIPEGVAGALALTFFGVAASGLFGGLVYRSLPSRLLRIERRSGLPEDAPAEREALVDALHAAISGANAAKKALVRGILLPYGADLGGTLALIASGRSLGEEEQRVLGRVERALGARKSERLLGIESLVRTAVEMRALRARRILATLLRAWLPLHLAGTGLLLTLLALHVVGALR